MSEQCVKGANSQLFREFTVIIPYQDIKERLDKALSQKAHNLTLPGFRRGKAPLDLVRKKYEADLLPDILDRLVEETSSRTLVEKKVKPALRPHIHLDAPYEEGKDLSYTMHFEVLPDVPTIDVATLTIDTYRITEDSKKLAELNALQAKSVGGFASITTARAAKKGDQVIIDFEGTVDGKALPGGSAKDFALELGSGQFIEGFEDGLIGKSKGDSTTLTLKFPNPYHDPKIAGKPVEFKVTIHDIKEPIAVAIDEALAKKLGFETLDALQTANKSRIRQSHAAMERRHAKQMILDALDQKYAFGVPEGLVTMEFDTICQQLMQEAPEGASQDEQKSYYDAHYDEWAAEFKPIANRRVRLGLVLAHLGVEHKIEVSNDELAQAALAEARNYPGQEKQVIDYYKNNPDALGRLRASVLEEKSIDFILKAAKIQEKEISEDAFIALQNKKLNSL